METLVVADHRNHHHRHGRSRGHGHGPTTRYDSFVSTQLGNLRGISCRAFESGAGLLPTPLKSLSTSVAKNAFTVALSPKTPSPAFDGSHNGSKRNAKTVTTPIPIKINFEKKDGEFYFSERWAGPAYSSSPPPSSLPLPKFSMWPKRTVSLDFPTLVSEIDMRPVANSAPASPTRGHSLSPRDFDSADSATKTLRRILNLDIMDE